MAWELNKRLAQWAQFLTCFDFKVISRPEKKQGRVDALTWHSYLALWPGDSGFYNKKQMPIGSSKLHATTVCATPVDSIFLDIIPRQVHSDDFAKDVLAHISPKHASCSILQGTSRCYKDFKWKDRLLFFKNILYVLYGAPCLRALEHCNDAPMARNFGSAKTMELVKWPFWWPHLQNFVEDYFRTCDTCSRAKMSRHHPYGLLQSLPPPSKPWKFISMDFIIYLPPLKGFDTILIVLDRFTKMTHFLPCVKSIHSQDTTDTIMREVFDIMVF